MGIHSCLLKTGWQRLFFIFLVSFEIIDFLFAVPAYLFTGDPITKGWLVFDSRWEEILIVVIAAPLVETFIFQYGMITLAEKYFKSRGVAIALSAFLFAMGHRYNAWYASAIFVDGLLLGYVYTLFRQRKSRPFCMVWALHFTNNFLAVAVSAI